MQEIFYPPHTGDTPPAHTYHARRPIIVSIIALCVLVALVVWLVRLPNTQPYTYDAGGNPVYHASKGQIIEGFPQELLLGQNMIVTESGRTDYESRGESLPYVRYTTEKPFTEVVEGYRELLQTQGWSLLVDGSPQEFTSTNLYAKRGDTEVVSVVLNKDTDSMTEILVAYSITTTN